MGFKESMTSLGKFIVAVAPKVYNGLLDIAESKISETDEKFKDLDKRISKQEANSHKMSSQKQEKVKNVRSEYNNKKGKFEEKRNY